MLNRTPLSTYIRTRSHSLKQSSKSCCPWTRWHYCLNGLIGPLYLFIYFFILKFGPTEIKATDLPCFCFRDMHYHNAFSFWHRTLWSSEGPLPSAETVCSVWLEYSWTRPWSPGFDMIGCQLKDIHLIQMTDEIAVSVYKVEETPEKCFPPIRKFVWIKSMAVGYIVYEIFYFGM